MNKLLHHLRLLWSPVFPALVFSLFISLINVINYLLSSRFLMLVIAFIYLVAPKRAVFLVWYTLLTCLHISSGPLRWEQAFNSHLADLSLASNWSQSSKIFCCRSLYFRHWILLSFLSDTSQIWSNVSLASLWRRWISRYIGSCLRLDACQFKP